MTPRWEATLFALALAVFGIAQSVYWHAGEDTYRELAKGRGQVTFVTPAATLVADESVLPGLHAQTLRYVLGTAAEPATFGGGIALFDAGERSHLADVRAVFGGLRVASIVAGLALLGLVARARVRRRSLRLVRDGAIGAAAAVVVVGVVAAVAFEPAFLAFHYLFFPQGNFLFDPATSNLLRLYPQPYWYGVTLRVGATFITAMAVIAAATSLVLRSRGARGS